MSENKETRFLSSVLFGGYERSAVDKRFEFLLSQVNDLKNELRTTKLMLAEYEKGTDPEQAAESVLAGERLKLTQAQTKSEKMTKRAKAAEEEAQQKTQEAEALTAEVRELKEKLRAAEDKIAALESGGDAATLSTVFIRAQASADELIENARRQAQELEANTRKLADNILAEANNTAAKVVFDAETKAAEITAAADKHEDEMASSSANLRAMMFTDIERMTGEMLALLEHLTTFSESSIASLTDTKQMLSAASEILKENGVPEFRVPADIQPQLPAEPEYQPVDHTYNGRTQEDIEKEAARNSELERLMQMAQSLDTDEDSAEPVAEPSPAPEAAPAPESSSAVDLDALAAMAAALGTDTQPTEPAQPEKKGQAPDLETLAALAAALDS